MEIIGMKEKVSFTIEKDLMSWFRLYCKDEYKTMSAVLSDYILNLKRMGSILEVVKKRFFAQ